MRFQRTSLALGLIEFLILRLCRYYARNDDEITHIIFHHNTLITRIQFLINIPIRSFLQSDA